MSQYVSDVDEAAFEAHVVQRSFQVPVVVDFWAAWCLPCRTLGPVLEQAVAARDGRVLLAKVDVDANPRLAQLFGVQGIPAVKAFHQGQPVSEFHGAQPRQQVERFLDALVAPPAPEPDQPQAAAERWRAALERDPQDLTARLGLAGLALDGSRLEQADELLRGLDDEPRAARLAARLRLSLVATDPHAPLAVIAGQALGGAQEQALAALLDLVRTGPGRDAAHALLLDVFQVLGDEDPRTRRYRRELMTTLY